MRLLRVVGCRGRAGAERVVRRVEGRSRVVWREAELRPDTAPHFAGPAPGARRSIGATVGLVATDCIHPSVHSPRQSICPSARSHQVISPVAPVSCPAPLSDRERSLAGGRFGRGRLQRQPSQHPPALALSSPKSCWTTNQGLTVGCQRRSYERVKLVSLPCALRNCDATRRAAMADLRVRGSFKSAMRRPPVKA